MKTDKMKRILGLIVIVCVATASLAVANPVKKTISVDGFEREYLVYAPSLLAGEKADGIIVCLHGFGRTMNDFFEQYDVTDVADALNLVIVAPQALAEQDEHVKTQADFLSTLTGNPILLNSVWGCGLSVKVSSFGVNIINEELNQHVDDVNFIDRMIDEIIAGYSLSEDNVFVLGTSMGGYMTYQYALQKGDRLSGIIPIAGSMGLSIKGMDYGIKVPVCDFHSVTDEVVPYTGSFSENVFDVSLAKPKMEVLDYWRATNATGEPVTEPIEYYPSTNGITVEKITYPSPDNEVIHYKLDGAPHSYFFKKENGDCMDHVEEIVRFVQSHMTENPNNNPVIAVQKAFFYPNPVHDRVYLNVTNGVITVYDLTGRNIYSQSFTDGQADLSSLKSGIYIIHIRSGNTVQTGKLIKK